MEEYINSGEFEHEDGYTDEDPNECCICSSPVNKSSGVCDICDEPYCCDECSGWVNGQHLCLECYEGTKHDDEQDHDEDEMDFEDDQS